MLNRLKITKTNAEAGRLLILARGRIIQNSISGQYIYGLLYFKQIKHTCKNNNHICAELHGNGPQKCDLSLKTFTLVQVQGNLIIQGNTNILE